MARPDAGATPNVSVGRVHLRIAGAGHADGERVAGQLRSALTRAAAAGAFRAEGAPQAVSSLQLKVDPTGHDDLGDAIAAALAAALRQETR